MRRLIRGGMVVDGEASAPFVADVLTDGQRIVEVGAVGAVEVAEEIDASGCVVTPGFIDMHSHSDGAVFSGQESLPKIAQGITTEVVGQDGLAYVPASAGVISELVAQLACWNQRPPPLPHWSIASYLSTVDDLAVQNAAHLVPHGNLRIAAVGYGDRPATVEERAEMRSLLDQALGEGAFGLSLGLTYPPGGFADEVEITDLAGVVARHPNAYLCPHTRGYAATAMDAYAECIRIAESAEIPLHLAHLQLQGPRQGESAGLLALISAARDRGVDVTFDLYPYDSSFSSLMSVLPLAVFRSGMNALRDQLRDPDFLAWLRESEPELGHDWSQLALRNVRADEFRYLDGWTIADAGHELGLPPTDVVCAILSADDLTTGCMKHRSSMQDILAFIEHPAHMIGSDGILAGDLPHPRAFGAFARYLELHRSERGNIDWVTAVHHLALAPARRLGFAERGCLTAGSAADIVMWSDEDVRESASVEAPRRLAEGVNMVMVNGGVIYRDGELTNASPGRGLVRGNG